jgi:DNA-binding beta-propeller fold protein YncE
MRPLLTVGALALSIAACAASAQQPPAAGPYNVVRTAKVGGDGGFDYIYADAVGRRLYIPRNGANARISVFNLDTLAPVGEIPKTGGHGVAVDVKSGHAFGSSKPVVMFDTKTLQVIKTIDAQGNPDGIFADPYNGRIYVFSHMAPNATVINPVDGSIVGTIDLGGAPEQAASDGKGKLYVALEDKDQIAVVDAKTLTTTAHYGLGGKCGGPAGLALDAKNQVLFAACHDPATMTMVDAKSGAILASLPIGVGVDGATFNPATMEAFSSQGDGSLTVVKELSPTKFVVEQTVKTPLTAKTLTLDGKTNHVLLMAAEFAPATEPTPAGGRPRRGPMVPDSFSIVVVGK